MQPGEADATRKRKPLERNASQALVEKIRDVWRVLPLSVSVGVAYTDRVQKAQPVGVTRLAHLVGDLPETIEDTLAGQLIAKPAEVVEAVAVLQGEFHGDGIADAGDPDRRAGLLDGSRPDIHCRVLREFAVPREGFALLPGLENQRKVLVEPCAGLNGRHSVVDVGIVGETDRKARDKAASADGVDHRVLLGDAHGLAGLTQ